MKRKKGEVSLERALSKLGFASRTVARNLIESKKVKVNGVLITNPSKPVTPEKAKIEVEGQKIIKSKFEFFIYHKPKGVVTTKSDEKGRKTVFTNLPNSMQSLHAIGRLDMHTTGLLCLTNDTQLSNWMTDPRNLIEREYIVTVKGEFSDSNRILCLNGIESEGELLKAKQIKIIKTSGKESLLQVTLIEGKNREIRRMFEYTQNEVIKLKRISFGNLKLGDLKVEEYKAVPHGDLKKIFPKFYLNKN